MMVKNNYRMAFDSLRSSRWRSFLTMLGVIIGVVAVVTVISIGEGVKRAITVEAESLGPNVVTVLPGNQIERSNGSAAVFNPFASVGFALTDTDLAEIQETDGVAEAIPFVRVPGVAANEATTVENVNVIATSGNVPQALGQDIRFGTWHESNTGSSREFAVIGSQVARELFGELAPVGHSFTVNEKSYTVRGVFDDFPRSPLPFMSTNYNRSIFVSYEENKRTSSTGQNIYQILVTPDDGADAGGVAQAIDETLLETRDEARDFTVLQRAETVDIYGGLLDIITVAIAAIAAISLFVGGVGIMNIMFVSVSERTSEIGIRKAIGATNGQIMNQFITEAVVLSFLGGIFGILGSLLVNYFIRLSTGLEPVILPEVLVLAALATFCIGVIFGTAPAIRAAHKDPIEALRYRM